MLRCSDEVDRVVVVLFDAGGDGEDIGIENDVLGRKPDLEDHHQPRVEERAEKV